MIGPGARAVKSVIKQLLSGGVRSLIVRMSATKAGKRPLRSLTPMEKLNAITRVSVGGESKASVARDIGVPESTLRGWCKNHDKISYQVKTVNSPETNSIDDAAESFTLKRIKLEPQAIEQPYNLSMKSDISDGSYSPESDQNQTLEGEYPQPAVPEREANTSPLNLTKAIVTPPSTEKTTLSDKEKNKAELAKLSAQLGLNRPEVKPVLNQWMDMLNLCQQQQSTTKLPKISPPATGLLTTVDKRDKLHQYQSRMEQTTSVYDSVSFWLRQQPYNTNPQVPFLPLITPSTSSATNVTNTATSTSNGDTSFLSADSASQMRLQMNLLYHQNYQIAQLQAAAAVAASAGQVSPSQPILYQQLTKECEREVNSENKTKEDNKTVEETTKEEDNKPKNGTKNRSVLDNLPLNNNVNNTKEDVEPLDAFEALDHGEKFLSWLEHCSDPAVTSWQLNTVQNLMKNLKNAFERRTHPSRIKKIRK